MYRTGDRGRLLNNGSLSFMERMDDDSQIKLRGQRTSSKKLQTPFFKLLAVVSLM